MVKIKFREDGWFEAGKDKKDNFSYDYLFYQAKQELKQKLTELNNKNLSRSLLEKALCKIEAKEPLKGKLYLEGDGIVVRTPRLGLEIAYLGYIAK